MQKKNTNKKTIIFQSVDSKSLCDALIQAKSKETGISIMRLIENALIKEFGFKNNKFTEWCREYSNCDATTAYVSLLNILPENSDIFAFYKLICRNNLLPIDNPRIMQHPIVVEMVKNDTEPGSNVNISASKAVEHIFQLCSKKDLNKIFYDFTYGDSNILDAKPISLEDMVMFLHNIDKRDGDKDG